MRDMEAIPETLEPVGELAPHLDDGALLDALERSAAQVRLIAPDLAGFSIASTEHGVTFTLVATCDEIAALDGAQYLSSGPCVEAMDDGRGIATTEQDLVSEPRWRILAQASAAAGVRSTLTIPILDGRHVVGTVNMYGRSDDTFDGKHAPLATVFRAWAPGAVTNAELRFATRRIVEGVPAKLRENATIVRAIGILAGSLGITVDDAREQLDDVAERAGVSAGAMARLIVEVQQRER
jgi:GAF domain-containing protein